MNSHSSKFETSFFQYFEKIEAPKHRDFINQQNNCVLCSTVLELRHTSDPVENSVKEEAFCTDCDLRVRAKNFTLN